MSIEAIWYASYRDGEPPKCNRLTRLPPREQLGMAFDLAVDRMTYGDVGRRSTGQISATGERYWHWPRQQRKYGDWWLLPERTSNLARRAREHAEGRARAAMERQSYLDTTPSYHDRIIIELRRLQRAAYRARRGPEPAIFRPIPRWVGKCPIGIRPDSDKMQTARMQRAEIWEQEYNRLPPWDRQNCPHAER